MMAAPPVPAAAPLLEVINLTKSYTDAAGHKVRAVDDVSFTLAHGEVLGIVGESGCGKTTLGRTIMRLMEPDAGTVRIDGQDFAALSGHALKAARRQMQMVFQDPFGSLNPRHKVGGIIGEPLIVHGLPDVAARVRALLDLVGLPPDAATRYPHEFSGGQRQRIAIARALALAPHLIIADEPVSALDVSIQSQIINLIVDLRARLNLSMIFISHDLSVVRHVSDRVGVMYFGKIVEMAPTATLFAAPRHPYTRALLAAVPKPVPEAIRRRLEHAAQKWKPVLQHAMGQNKENEQGFDFSETKHALAGASDAASIPHGEVPDPAHPPPGCAFAGRCPLVEARCIRDKPELISKSDGHQVACYLA